MFENLGVINIEVYIVAVILVILAPGPNSLFVLSTSLKYGVRKGYKAALAVFIGDYVLMFLTFIGIAAILNQSPRLYYGMKVAGACFLAYLASQIIYGTFFAQKQEETRREFSDEPSRVFTKALLLSLTNPKALLFFFAFFPAFINVSFRPTVIPFTVLTIILQLVSMTYLSLLIFAGAKLLNVAKGYKWLAVLGNVSVAIIFIVFSILLVWD